jgi:hypothetical protein
MRPWWGTSLTLTGTSVMSASTRATSQALRPWCASVRSTMWLAIGLWKGACPELVEGLVEGPQQSPGISRYEGFRQK